MSATYFARVNDENIVVSVQVVSQQFINENPELYPGLWVETFIDTPGKTYAGIGYIYNSQKNDFTMPEHIQLA